MAKVPFAEVVLIDPHVSRIGVGSPKVVPPSLELAIQTVRGQVQGTASHTHTSETLLPSPKRTWMSSGPVARGEKISEAEINWLARAVSDQRRPSVERFRLGVT